MSELLLQGATMTGKHCGECGDPIFRYDGQEFCPTCQREVEGGAGEQETTGQGTNEQGATEAGEDDESGTDPDATGGESTDGESDEGADDEPRVEINDVRVADQHADRSNLRQPPSRQGGDDRHDPTSHQHESTGHQRDSSTRRRGSSRGRAYDHSHERARTPRERGHGRSDGRTGAPASDAGDLATARDSLVRTLTDLARRAEETDDVARLRDLLAATREAAEALAALDRADR